MDPNPTKFPILSFVMDKVPAIKRTFSTSTTNNNEFDLENPKPTASKPHDEPHFELSEKMPHLKNPKLVSAMQFAVKDVAQARSVLNSLGTRPDHETIDHARLRLSEGSSEEDHEIYKAVVDLDEMHEAYERLLSEAESRLEKIYEAAVSGEEMVVEGEEEKEVEVVEEEVNEEVVGILKEVEQGKVIERVDLSGRGLRIFPEAFGRFKSFVVLDFSSNQIEVIPDSIAGLENLEELYLSTNLLESLPDSIGLLFNLKVLDVSRNKLASLPDSICHCRSLVELDASFNKLTYLPTNIGYELVNLKRLSIHLNKIRFLPSSIGEMKSLSLLDVHFNELHGLPKSIGRLTNLEALNLGSNFSDLTELPDTISDLTSLKELDLSNNQIHALPHTFGRLVNLTKLNVDENPLVIPPKEVVAQGVEAIRAYMTKRWDEILLAEEQKLMAEVHEQAQAGLLTRSTSWLNNFVSNVSGTVSGYLGGAGKSNADPYLNQLL